MHDAWSITGFVVLLVVGIATVQAMIWVPIIVWFRRKSRAARGRLAAEMESETVIRPPETGVYRGATAPGFPSVNNKGLIALSRRRLAFVMVTGRLVEIPVAEIRGVHESKVFKHSVVGGRKHLVIELPSGEVGFFVSDNAGWATAVMRIVQPQDTSTQNQL